MQGFTRFAHQPLLALRDRRRSSCRDGSFDRKPQPKHDVFGLFSEEDVCVFRSGAVWKRVLKLLHPSGKRVEFRKRLEFDRLQAQTSTLRYRFVP